MLSLTSRFEAERCQPVPETTHRTSSCGIDVVRPLSKMLDLANAYPTVPAARESSVRQHFKIKVAHLC